MAEATPLVALANLCLEATQQTHHAMDSPNAMALDPDDTHVIQANGTADKDSVTEIIPDGLNGVADRLPDSINGVADQLPDLPLATNCAFPDPGG